MRVILELRKCLCRSFIDKLGKNPFLHLTKDWLILKELPLESYLSNYDN